MGQATDEQRWRMVRLYQNGKNCAQIAMQFAEEGVSITAQSVRRIIKHFKDTGGVSNTKRKRRIGKVTEDQRAKLFKFYANQDNWEFSNKQMFHKLSKELNLTVHYSTFIRTKMSFGFGTGPIKYVPLIR